MTMHYKDYKAGYFQKMSTYLLVLFLVLLGKIQIANGTLGPWVTFTIDPSGNAGMYTSIALDSSNNPHISYYDWTNGDLKYATFTFISTPASITTIDTTDDAGQYTSIAVDSSNNPHISYAKFLGSPSYNYNLKYATIVSGTPSITTVDSSGSVGEYTSIALDSSNNPHISYYGATNQDLMYAIIVSGTPSITTVDNSGNVGYYTSIALDSGDKVHISYYDLDNGYLNYATNASGSWVTSTIDSSASVGEYTSIAVDKNDKVHISYLDNTNHKLKYATNASGSWIPETIDDSTEMEGKYTSIALDSSNNPHISYAVSCVGDCIKVYNLKYATFVSPTWSITTVDNSGSVGEYSSIALDSSNTPHISYKDASNGYLKYASTSPAVTSISPSNGASGVLISSPITVTFSKDMYPFSINFSTFSISGVITGTMSYDAPTKTATFTPSPNLAYNTSYTATVTTGVQDYEGINMASAYIWQFTTESLIPPPPPSYTLQVIKAGTGSGKVTGAGIDCGVICFNSYYQGTWVTLNATPADDSTFTGWSGGGCSGTETCTVALFYDNATVTADFILKTYTMTSSAEGHGTITPSGEVILTHGANQTFTMTPDAGAWIKEVKVDGASVGVVDTYTFTNVTANHTITVTFTDEAISTPITPAGPDRGVKGTSYTYTTEGSSSSLDHPVEYQVDWGDGTYSDWSSTGTFTKIWSASDTYTIKAQARCSLDTMVLSDWSEGITVDIQDECSTWADVIARYLTHEIGQANWESVINCYKGYVY